MDFDEEDLNAFANSMLGGEKKSLDEIISTITSDDEEGKEEEDEVETVEQYACPACGEMLDMDAASCHKCGVEFTEDVVEQFECPICNSIVDGDASKCPNCGAEFVSEEEAEEEYEEETVEGAEFFEDSVLEDISRESEMEEASSEAEKIVAEEPEIPSAEAEEPPTEKSMEPSTETKEPLAEEAEEPPVEETMPSLEMAEEGPEKVEERVEDAAPSEETASPKPEVAKADLPTEKGPSVEEPATEKTIEEKIKEDMEEEEVDFDKLSFVERMRLIREKRKHEEEKEAVAEPEKPEVSIPDKEKEAKVSQPEPAPTKTAPAPTTKEIEEQAPEAAKPKIQAKKKTPEEKRSLSTLVKEIKPILALARENEVDVSSERESIDKAIKAAKSKRKDEAVELLTKANDEVKMKINRKLVTDLQEIEKEFNVAKDLGLEVQDIEKDLAFANKKLKMGDVLQTSEAILQLENRMTGEIGDVLKANESIQRAQNIINQAKDFGIDVTEANQTLNLAKGFLDSGEVDKAVMFSKKVTDNLSESIPHMVKEEMKKAKANLLKAKMTGKDISKPMGLMKSASIALKTQDYHEALEKITQFKEAMGRI